MQGEKETNSHESYGMVSISRVHSGANHRFFGSDLAVSDYFVLKIVQGEVDRTLSSERPCAAHPRKTFIEINMTGNQLTEMITSMNRGDGIPCTIAEFDGKKVPQVKKPENRKEFTQRKFKEQIAQLGQELAEQNKLIETILKKDKLSAADKAEIKSISSFMVREIQSNIPYVATCFQETMDTIVLDAKTTIDASLQHQINTAGLRALNLDEQSVLNTGRIQE